MTTGPVGNIHTPLCSLLGCDNPILLAGMGGVAGIVKLTMSAIVVR